MPLTILITGFGPFPTAPFNPTETLVRRLARIRRPALADVRIVPHVFATSYQAVDRDLSKLIANHAPDAILMFGLAARRSLLTVETRARNAVSTLLVDAEGALTRHRAIVPGQPAARLLAPWCRTLVRPIKAARVPAKLSRDAGRYVCNYLCWRTAEAAAQADGPLAAFVHIPQIRRSPRRFVDRRPRQLTVDDLVRAGEALLVAAVAAARKNQPLAKRLALPDLPNAAFTSSRPADL